MVSSTSLTFRVATDIAERLRDLVEATGLSQARLASRAGVGAHAFTAWVRGRRRPPATRLRSWAKREGWPAEIFAEGGPMPSTALGHSLGRSSRISYLDDAMVTTPGDRSQLGAGGQLAAMVAHEIARVVALVVAMDEAGQTREGRNALAEALEDFAARLYELRGSIDVAEIYGLARKLRRGVLG